MEYFFRNKIFIIISVFVIVGVGVWVYADSLEPQELQQSITLEQEPIKSEVIGVSREGREIEAVTYGNGDTQLVFAGGMHGGYEWNSVLLAYKAMDYFEENVSIIPENIKITIIPVLNPDGLYKVIGKEGRFEISDVSEDIDTSVGRFNAHEVDLNRNFDCKWQSKSKWRGNVVSAGGEVFSEPETQALRDFILRENPTAVVFWHSQSNAVYASECENGVLSETLAIMNTYAKASKYKPVESFDAYEITGDAEGWLASINIPAITVELSTHETIEWTRNLAGIMALLGYYGE